MLPNRSIFFQVCLLLIVTHCNSQDYEYGVDESDHSDVQDDADHPDYSKYYSVDTSAPLVSSQGSTGFTSPIEFSGFFGPIEFGASGKQEVTQPKNPFVAKENKVGFTDEKFPEFFAGSTYPKDYFEESQKQQQRANEDDDDESQFEVAPGPNYISHQLPAKHALEGGYTSQVEHIDDKTPKYKNNKKSSKDYDEDYQKSSAEADKYKLDDYSYDYTPVSGKYADYNVGKSSSTVSQHPAAPGLSKKFTASPTISPYQKYSFQPVTEGFESKYLQGLISTVAPFNPAYNKVASTISTPVFETQPSENVPSHLQGKGCRRVKKNVDDKDAESGKVTSEAMNCFVCEDPKTGTKYTQCSYTSEPNAKNEYKGTSERYSTPGRAPDGFRYKRYSGDDYNVDPYEYIKKRSQASETEPSEETKDYEEYKIPDYFYSDAPDKSFSEVQSEQIAKNPGNCIKEEKSGMTCTICKDPKTGGNFEQCSYTSEPKEQKYAYVTEKKYNSNDDPEESSESKPVAQTKKAADNDDIEKYKKYNPREEFENANQESLDLKYKPIINKKSKEIHDLARNSEKPRERSHDRHQKYRSEEEEEERDERPAEEAREKYRSEEDEDRPKGPKKYRFEDNEERAEGGFANKAKAPKKLIDDEPYDVPKHFAESTIKEQKTNVKNIEPSSYDGEDYSEAADSPNDRSLPYKDVDEYHFKLFPEFSNEESKQAEVVAQTPETTRKDVEEVLAEFSKKDRSACKKAEKKGMTCYLCVDEKGIQHEECMYVSESKPQASHVAYHEVKQIKSPDAAKNEQLEPAATEIKRKRFFKKVTTPAPFTLEAAASEEVETKVKYSKPNKNRKRNLKKANKKKRNDSERLEDDEDHPPPKTPAEFAVAENEGAYSEETKPVYSKTHGVKLPKYMLEKSEFEQEFDEFAGVNY